MDFLKNKKVLIIIFIFVFVILAALNFYNIKDTIKDNVIEPFEAELDEDQNVGQNKVIIDNTDNVNFNSFGAIKTGTNLTNLLKTAGNWNLTWNSYNKNSLATNEGGAISLGNPNKSEDNNKVDNWTLFNMTGHYGDGLHFYKYSGGIANNDNAKFINRGSQLVLYDNGWSKFFGPLAVAGDLYPDANCFVNNGSLKVRNMWFDGTTINAAGGRMHITGTELLYLLNKNGVIIGKEWGGNGNLVVQGNLAVNGTISGTMTSSKIEGTLNVTGKITCGGGIEFSDKVRIAGTTAPWTPNEFTCINEVGIQFGGPNKGREENSAQITAGRHIADTLCIVGMSRAGRTYTADRKIFMWAEGGLGISGPVNISGNLYAQGETYLNNRLYVNNEIRANPGAANPNLHLVTKRAMFLMAENVYIYKEPNSDYWYKPSGNLIVQGNLSANQEAYIGGGLHAPRAYMATNSPEGGHICLINPSKRSNNNLVENWTIFNMTGGYGNGLHFWKYSGEGSKFINRGTQLALWDNGYSAFYGPLHVTGHLHLDNHLRVAGGVIYLGPDTVIVGNGSSVSINTNSRHIDFFGNEFFNIYNRLGLAVRSGQTYGDFRWFSDIRLKENIKTINENEKDKVLQLVPKTYNLIADEKKTKRYGFIAQEVEELYPELISIDDKGMKAVNYSDLIPLLLEQIKELKKSIPNQNVVNTNVLNIGGVTLNANELQKLKQLINQ